MGVLVLGMHRSGTSALAGTLEAMGLEVGPSDDVMPADDGNPEGYFELLSVVQANDDLLAHFGGRWDSPPALGAERLNDEAVRAFVRTGRVALGELFTSDKYLLKDPRISILLPVWRQITNDQGCSVAIVRDPLEVAASLTRRNGLPTLTGLALWSAYNRSMFNDLHGARVHVCNYADLVENPVRVLTDIVASLREWGVVDDIDFTKTFASVRPELRRNTIVNSDVASEAAPVEIKELVKLALDLRGRHDSFDMGRVLEAGWWESGLLEERRVLLQWALGEIAELQTHNTNLATENAILWERGDAATHEANLLRAENERMRSRVPKPLLRLFNLVHRQS